MNKMKIIDNLSSSSFVRYGIVGVGSLIVDYGLLLIGYHVLGIDLPVATTLAFFIGLIFNFIVNKLWSFRSRGGTVRKSVKEATFYALLVTFNLLFTNLFVYYTYQVDIGPEVSKIITTILATVWNFIIYKKVIFKREPLVGISNAD